MGCHQDGWKTCIGYDLGIAGIDQTRYIVCCMYIMAKTMFDDHWVHGIDADRDA